MAKIIKDSGKRKELETKKETTKRMGRLISNLNAEKGRLDKIIKNYRVKISELDSAVSVLESRINNATNTIKVTSNQLTTLKRSLLRIRGSIIALEFHKHVNPITYKESELEIQLSKYQDDYSKRVSKKKELDKQYEVQCKAKSDFVVAASDLQSQRKEYAREMRLAAQKIRQVNDRIKTINNEINKEHLTYKKVKNVFTNLLGEVCLVVTYTAYKVKKKDVYEIDKFYFISEDTQKWFTISKSRKKEIHSSDKKKELDALLQEYTKEHKWQSQ